MASTPAPNRVTIEGGVVGEQFVGFPTGVDSFSHPLSVKPDQLRWMVNAVTQGAFVQTRPGFKTRLEFDLRDTSSEFHQWWVAAGSPVIHPQMMVFFRPINSFPQLVFAVSGSVWWCQVNYDGSLSQARQITTFSFNPNADLLTGTSCTQTASVINGVYANNVAPRNLLVIQDGLNRAGIWDGSLEQVMNPEKKIHTSSLGDTYYDDGWNETRIGLWCAWSGNRLWVAQGRSVRASDLGDPTHFTEELTLTALPEITLPENVTSLKDRGTSGTTRSQLVAFTRNTTSVIWSGVQARFATANSQGWANTDDFVSTIFSGVGCVAGKSPIVHRGLLYWKSKDGIVLFDSTGTVNSTQNLPAIDQEMAYSKRLSVSPVTEGSDLTCSGSRASYVFWGVPTGAVTNGRVYNSHIHVLDRQTMVVRSVGTSGPFSYATTGWQGIWTGIRPVEWAEVPSSPMDRSYALSMDTDGVVRIWEAFQGSRSDNGHQIPWSVETPMHRVSQSVFDYSNFRHFRLLLDQIRGNLTVRGAWRGMRGSYHEILSTQVTATPGSVLSPLPGYSTVTNDTEHESFLPQGRTVVSPDVRNSPVGCTSVGVESQYVDTKDHAFSLLFNFQGHGAMVAYRFAADQMTDNTEGEANPQLNTGVNEDGFNIASQAVCPKHTDGVTPEYFLADTVAANAFFPYLSSVDDSFLYSANPRPEPSAPVITMQPSSQSTTTGTTVVLTTSVAGLDLSFQWFKNNTMLPGATSPTLTLSNVQTEDSGSYSLVVSNSAGSTTSSSAVIIVSLPPVGISITSQPTGGSISTSQSFTFSVSVSGTAPISYQWKKNGYDLIGGTATSYTIPSAVVEDSGTYTVMITNAAGSVLSNGAVLTVTPLITVPIITVQPNPLSVIVGQSATFSVTATGIPTLTYQWQKGGVDILGATNSTYTIGSPVLGDAGNYSVNVTNSGGTKASNTVALAVTAGAVAPTIITQPVGMTIYAGTPVFLSVVASGTATLVYQWKKGGVDILGATSPTYDLLTPVVGDSGNYTVQVTNSAGSLTSSIAALVVNAPVYAPTITVQPTDVTVLLGLPASLSVTATGTPTILYQWFKNGVVVGGATSATYNVAATALSDTGLYTVRVTNAQGTVYSDPANLLVSSSSPLVFLTQPTGKSIVTGNTFTLVSLASGAGTISYQWRKNGTPLGGATGANFTVVSAALADAGSYTVVATDVTGSITSNAATVVVTNPAIAPAITTQPISRQATVGDAVTFSVVATGDPVLQYQWKKGGVNIVGANGSAFTLSPVALGDAANYTVVVTNGAGSVTSSIATLAVSSPPTPPNPPSLLWYSTKPTYTDGTKPMVQLDRTLASLPFAFGISIGTPGTPGAALSMAIKQASTISGAIPSAFLDQLYLQVQNAAWSRGASTLTGLWLRPNQTITNFSFNQATQKITFTPKSAASDFDATAPQNLYSVYNSTKSSFVYINLDANATVPAMNQMVGYTGTWVGQTLTLTGGNLPAPGDVLILSGNVYFTAAEASHYSPTQGMPASWIRPIIMMDDTRMVESLPGAGYALLIDEARIMYANTSTKWMYLTDFLTASALP